MATIADMKLAAAEAAAALIKDGMLVGLGTGSTATLAVAAIGKRVAQGLSITGIATSQKTADQARSLGIPISTLDEHDRIDVTIDGADEVERGTLALIKGRGGALLREKIVASASERLVIIVDEDKLVDSLCAGAKPIPVEVVPFGWHGTAKRLSGLGATPTLRLTPEGKPFVTDGGHFILDCVFPEFDAAILQTQLDAIVGVVEHGLFLGLTSEVIVGRATESAGTVAVHLRASMLATAGPPRP
jgi:ribose 5-phosphate isomerase A